MNVQKNGAALVNVTTVSGSKTITPAAMTGITRGQGLVATGVPTGAYVERVDATTIEISAAATASATVAGSFNDKPMILGDFPFYTWAGAFGADWSGLTLPTPENGVGFAIVKNTEDSSKYRLYVYALSAWKYEELS